MVSASHENLTQNAHLCTTCNLDEDYIKIKAHGANGKQHCSARLIRLVSQSLSPLTATAACIASALKHQAHQYQRIIVFNISLG